VYLELLRRGYRVSIDKIDGLEIDLVAENGKERLYYQVATSVLAGNNFAREIKPLKKVADNYSTGKTPAILLRKSISVKFSYNSISRKHIN